MGLNKYFTQIDLRNGFNQILLDGDCKKYTSFFLLWKQWQYNRVPFGMTPGPKILQRCISDILDGIENCLHRRHSIVFEVKRRASKARFKCIKKTLKDR